MFKYVILYVTIIHICNFSIIWNMIIRYKAQKHEKDHKSKNQDKVIFYADSIIIGPCPIFSELFRIYKFGAQKTGEVNSEMPPCHISIT